MALHVVPQGAEFSHLQAKVLFESTNALYLQWQQGDDMPGGLPGEIAASVTAATSDGNTNPDGLLRGRNNSTAKVISLGP